MRNDRYETGHLVARSGELTQRIHWNDYKNGGTATDARRRTHGDAVSISQSNGTGPGKSFASVPVPWSSGTSPQSNAGVRLRVETRAGRIIIPEKKRTP